MTALLSTSLRRGEEDPVISTALCSFLMVGDSNIGHNAVSVTSAAKYLTLNSIAIVLAADGYSVISAPSPNPPPHHHRIRNPTSSCFCTGGIVKKQLLPTPFQNITSKDYPAKQRGINL